MQRSILWTTVLALMAAGCAGSTGEGTFEVTFTWADGQPALGGGEWVRARVEERDDLVTPGRVLGTAGPLEWAEVVEGELRFEDIPNGDRRVVIAEILDGEGSTANVLYYGISRFFSLEAGKHTVVEVRLHLTAVPSDVKGGVEILEGDLVNGPDVTLALFTDTGTRVQISHFVSFPEDKTLEESLAGLPPWPDAPPDSNGYLLDWSLDYEPVYDCSGEDYCPRRVFVRFLDVQGYASRTLYDDVNFDQNPPDLVEDGVNVVPLKANTSDRVSVCLTFTEQVVADPVLAVDQVPGFSFYKVVPENDDPSNSYCFASEGLAGELGAQDAVYDLSVVMTDRAQNRTVAAGIGVIEVDSTNPEISDVQVPDAANAADQAGGADLSLSFTISEAPGPSSPKVLVGPYADPDPCACTARGGLSDPYDCTCGYTLGARDTDGEKIVNILVTDLAGNTTEDTGSSITFDFYRPELVPDSVSLHFEPDAGNVLDEVTEAKENTVVRVYFTLSEALDGIPVVTTQPGGITFDYVEQVGNTYEFEHPVGGEAEVEFQLRVSAQDTAGNPMDPDPHPLEVFYTVDKTQPNNPATGTFERIMLTRRPWGTNAGMQVTGGNNAVEPGAWAIFMIDSENEITRVQADGNGAFDPVDLNISDRPEVYVKTADTAGNESNLRKIRDVEWVANFSEYSPLFLEERSWFGSGLFQTDGLEVADPINLYGPEGTLESVVGKPRGWTSLTYEPTAPVARGGHGAAYDSARAQLVVFGGISSLYNAETWEWDGLHWKQVCGTGTSCAGPRARSSFGMAYDSARGVVVLFGGDQGWSDPMGDTWEWDGIRWSRKCLDQECSANMPSPRWGQSMVYDEERGRVVLFGGCSQMNGVQCSVLESDTWEWDGKAWNQVGNSGPSARMNMAFTYDTGRDLAVLHGGCTSFSSYCQQHSDETWTWNGTTWNKVCGSGTGCSGPSARYRHSMAHDPARDRVVLFGGMVGNGGYLQDTWEWNGSGWNRVCAGSTECESPHVRSRHSVTWHPRRNRVVMYGGRWSWPSEGDELFDWDGEDWHLIHSGQVAPDVPSGRTQLAVAWDPDRERGVLYGGCTDLNCVQVSDQTWEWDGIGWELKCGTGTGCNTHPGTRYLHAMAYDETRNRTVLFGGFDGAPDDELWEWNGTSWVKRCGSGTACSGPTARYGHSMVWDPNRNRIVAHGGCTTGNGSGCTAFSDETWEWNGSSWLKRCGSGTGCSAPTARDRHAMAWDRERNVGVLLGGCRGWSGSGTGGLCSSRSDETWEWSGSAWTLRCGGATGCDSPDELTAHTLIYDAGRGRVVSFGGSIYNIVIDESYAWDGNAWTHVCGLGTDCAGPEPHLNHAMVYDPVRGEALLAGGEYLDVIDDIWRWDGGGSTRPGQVLTVPFSEAMEGSTSGEEINPFVCIRDPANCPIRAVRVSWSTGGSSEDPNNPGSDQDGSLLHTWSRGEWIPLEQNDTPAFDYGDLDFDINTGQPPDQATAKEIGSLFFTDDYNLHFAVTPLGNNGQLNDMAVVSSDYLEVTVQYRLDP